MTPSFSNLKHISNNDLNNSFKKIVQCERELLSQIILHIQEVYKRKLFLEMGYASMFAYMTEYLGYSSGSAQRRIDAARLASELPEVINMLETGQTDLSKCSMIQKTVRYKENVEQIKIATDLKKDLLLKIQNQTKHQAQVEIAKKLNVPIKIESKQQHQKDESVRLEVTFTKEQWQKISEMQALLSHSTDSSDFASLFTYLADKVILSKTELNSRDKPAKVNNKVVAASDFGTATVALDIAKSNFNHQIDHQVGHQTDSHVEHRVVRQTDRQVVRQADRRKPIGLKVKKYLYAKYKTCQFVDRKTKKQCCSKWHLTIEHLQPVWAGGSNDLQNLTVLCGAHNRHKYFVQSGKKYI